MMDKDVEAASSLIAVDLDGDCESDLIAAAAGSDQVIWWENSLTLLP
jgi:hypothetical protein